nr:TetR/AcrR family transcriptional regulator C-terminal domain-containing protein [Nocardioides dongkuii]
MTDLFRIVIAELPRFPELANAQFSQGKMPYFESVRATCKPRTKRERPGSTTWNSPLPSSWA